MSQDPIYRELQRHLDKMPVPFPPTTSGVELRILERLFTPEEAQIALALSAIPEPLAPIHRRLKRHTDEESLRRTLDDMGVRGLITRQEAAGKVQYGKAVFVVGIYESQVGRLTAELERDVRQYLDEAFGPALFKQKTPQMRSIPVNRRIIAERNVGRYDDIRSFVETTGGPFAVLPCICRKGRDLLSEPCKQTEGRENCLVFGVAAKAVVEKGVGRFVSRDEILAMLDLADREGLVLEPQNTQDPWFVCCCCGCCCGVLTTAKKLPRPAEYFRANYYAEVDAAACQDCGICITRCQMEAITEQDGGHKVDRTRCIGCGLCVTTCESGAMQLRKKLEETAPPKDVVALYTQMTRDRYGTLGTAVMVGKKLLGMKS